MGCSCIAVADRPATAEKSDNTLVVRVHHPGFTDEPVACSLVVDRDAAGKITGYRTEVLSVFCADGVCRAVPVCLYWDALGNYTRFTVKQGMHLEKADGKPFAPADYRKLDTILSNPESPLRDVGAFAFSEHSGTTLPVDAMSAPTPVVFEGAVVEGAAWTCFTLWHWVHGELRSEIRRITASAWTSEDISEILLGESNDAKSLAIAELIRRKQFDRETAERIAGATRTASREVTQRAIEYALAGPPEIGGIILDRLFLQGTPTQRAAVLTALLRCPDPRVEAWKSRIAVYLSAATSYPEIDRIFRILESHALPRDAFVPSATRLLHSEDFLTARRAYWFLRTCDVSPEIAEELEAFRRANANRL
ncbi:hypothetical protein JCM19992_20510 [Thermostilla marina]